jgi:hypothetical protein
MRRIRPTSRAPRQLCEDCQRRAVSYLDGRSYLCRICLALRTGFGPADLAKQDAGSEDEYACLVEEYSRELWANPDLAAYYQRRGLR